MLVCALRLYPATLGWVVRCGCVCLGSGSDWPRLSWLGCWGVRVCVFVPLVPRNPAGVCGVVVCAWARIWAAPRHSWLGCWGVCVFVCALRLYPATPGWGVRCGCVCLGSGSGCAPPLLAGVLGCACLCARSACTPQLLAGVRGVVVCAWALVPAAPCHSWLGCWGVCVCWCARSACTPPLLAGVRGVGGCAWALTPVAPRHSWLGCWGVRVRAPLVPCHSWLGCAVWFCVLGLRFRLRPATPSWGVGVCVFVCALRLYPATPGWGVRSGCVCSGSVFGCAPPLLAGVLVCARVCGRAPLIPHYSWLGCAVLVGVLGPWLRLRPATPGWGVGVCVCALLMYPASPGWGLLCGCVCLSSGFGCAPPLLAGALGSVSCDG